MTCVTCQSCNYLIVLFMQFIFDIVNNNINHRYSRSVTFCLTRLLNTELINTHTIYSIRCLFDNYVP